MVPSVNPISVVAFLLHSLGKTALLLLISGHTCVSQSEHSQTRGDLATDWRPFRKAPQSIRFMESKV